MYHSRPTPPPPSGKMMIYVGLFLMGIGGFLYIYNSTQDRSYKPMLEELRVMSRSGDPKATENWEQAVNRYNAPPVKLRFEGNSEEVEERHLADNKNALIFYDRSTYAERINIRRNWNMGLNVNLLGVVDMHNFAIIDVLRARRAEAVEARKRHLAAIRTVANWFRHDPMVETAEHYAPTMHLYLFALEERLNNDEFSVDELRAILAELRKDNAAYAPYFRQTLELTGQLLGALPASVEAYPQKVAQEILDADGAEAVRLLAEYSKLLEAEYYVNAEKFAAWQVPEAADRQICAVLVPTSEYAVLLARLTTHNRMAQAAIMTAIGEPGAAVLTNAFTGEPLHLEMDDQWITVSTTEFAPGDATRFRIPIRSAK